MKVVFLETNFLVGYARGQAECPEQLLQFDPALLSLRVPEICCMEALKVAVEWEKESEASFRTTVTNRIRLLGRDKSSPTASSLVAQLQQLSIDNNKWLNDTEKRLYAAIELLASRDELFFLPARVWQEHRTETLSPKDQADNLILHAVLGYAASISTPKAFFSNDKIFADPAAVQKLKSAGIDRFSDYQALLQWITKPPGS